LARGRRSLYHHDESIDRGSSGAAEATGESNEHAMVHMHGSCSLWQDAATPVVAAEFRDADELGQGNPAVPLLAKASPRASRPRARATSLCERAGDGAGFEQLQPVHVGAFQCCSPTASTTTAPPGSSVGTRRRARHHRGAARVGLFEALTSTIRKSASR
jgi:hypothetical protein